MESVPLPTGGCNFRDLATGIALTCGCQRFWLRRRGGKGKVKGKGRAKGRASGKKKEEVLKEDPRLNRAAAAADSGSDSDADSDPDAECRCGHHACYHSSGSDASDRFGANLGFSGTSGTTTERGYSTTEPSLSAARHRKPCRGDCCPECVRIVLGSVLSHGVTAAQMAKVLEDVVELKQTARVHHERLETVETFGSAIEDMRDKVDLAEDRANEVEEKVASFENRLDDRAAAMFEGGEKRKPDEDASRARKRQKGAAADKTTMTPSFNTTTSTSTSFSGRDEVTTSRLLSFIDSHEQRIADLESTAPPSVCRPWVLEAVLLPPAPLRGIWADPTCAGGYESSGPQSVSTVSGTPPRRESTTSSSSSSSSSHLHPRSFGINSRLYRRLHTRGFIKPLHITGPSAHDVSSAITSAFGSLLDWCRSFHPTSTWQPLRKVHKKTTLEFLAPAEAAGVLWSVDFLRSSCIMRGRRQVLYLAILPQPPHASVSWASVRALAPTSSEDAACWEWKDTLDAEFAPTEPRPGTEGMTPALTARTAASSRAASVERGLGALSRLESYGAELSRRTIEWFMENPGDEGETTAAEEEEEQNENSMVGGDYVEV